MSRSCSGHAPGPHRDLPGRKGLPRLESSRNPRRDSAAAWAQAARQYSPTPFHTRRSSRYSTVRSSPIPCNFRRRHRFLHTKRGLLALMLGVIRRLPSRKPRFPDGRKYARWVPHHRRARRTGLPDRLPGQACEAAREMVLSARLERWPSGRRRTPGKCVGGKPSRGFESLSLRQPPTPAPQEPPGSPPAAPGPTPSPVSRSVSVRPRSASASRTPGRISAAISAAVSAASGRFRGTRTSRARIASSASGVRASPAASAAATAGPPPARSPLDELRARAAPAGAPGSAARRRARGRSRGTPGCASASAGWRWRRAPGAPPPRSANTPRSVARAATRARSYWLSPTRISFSSTIAT